MFASCIGHEFDLRSLATIAEDSVVGTAANLWEAIREGLLLPLDSDYRYFEDTGATRSREIAIDFNVHYRFLHDRVLQAAYSLVEADKKRDLHLSIGRLLRRRGQSGLSSGADPRDDDLLDIVRHLNLGKSGITDPAERLDLARLNLRAGRKAKAATAYKAAADYLRAGIAITSDADWEADYDLCFALHLEGAECEYASDNAERADALFALALPHVKTDVDRAAICRLRVYILTARTHFTEALTIGLEGLTMLGYPCTFEEIGSQETFGAELGQIQVNLAGRRIEDLIDAPKLEDPVARAALDLLLSLIAPAHNTSPIIYGNISLKATNLILKHGLGHASAYPFASTGYLFALLLGRVEEGLAFGRLALEIYKRNPNLMEACAVHMVCGCMISMQRPFHEAEQMFDTSRQWGLASGDFQILGTACFLATLVKLIAGNQLEDVLDNADRHLAIARRTKDPFSVAAMTVTRQAVACLLGRTRAPTSFSDDGFDEEQFIGRLDDAHFGHALFHHYFLKILIHYIHGDIAGAEAAAQAAEPRVGMAGGNQAAKTLPFYRCLVLFALPAPASPEEANRRAELIAQYRQQLDVLAACAPMNFQHMKVLIDAEAARSAGDVGQAIRLYERALTLAGENKSAYVEAIAGELCAKYCLSLGLVKGARAYLRDACRAYLHWGATTKAEALQAEYAHVWPRLRRDKPEKSSSQSSSSRSSETDTGGSILSRTSLGSLRDAAIVLRAAQAISGEVDLPRVIERLAALVLENAGAERGALILSREGQLFVDATFGLHESAAEVGQGQPLDETEGIARSVVLYVARTQDPVVLDNAGTMTRFSDDPHVSSGRPKSILCIPLLHQARLSGVLYLENTVTSSVFNASRVELLALLSSQAAIAIENARLFTDVRAANTEIRRVNERLELEVASRTDELRRANKDLFTANERLERELARRNEIEQERMALQEQVIAAQRDRLTEMSTPLIPITDDIMVMPLIGTVDRERATQVISVALAGAQRHRARVVILDITGIKQIDSHVAGTLIGMAGALRMLGTHTVLTGMAPDIARTLVHLNVDFSSFVTLGTLQSGIAYALKRVQSAGLPGITR